MRSLHTRLTLINALVLTCALGVLAIALVQLGFQLAVAPLMDDVTATVAHIDATVAANSAMSTGDLVNRVLREGARGNAVIVGPPRDRAFGGGLTPPVRGPFPSPLDPGHPHDDERRDGGPNDHGPGHTPRDDEHANGDGFAPPPGRIDRERFDLRRIVGLRPQVVVIRETGVLVLPDQGGSRRIETAYVQTLIAALVAAVLASFFIARWLAAQAVEPLASVTNELRRFASGDFTPRTVTARSASELGDLIVAYNGAAAQVAAAFRERERAEAQMRRFVGDAGHELRTPLTAISGYVQLLERGGDRDPALRAKAFATLAKELARIRLLVERLVSLSQLDETAAGDEQDIDVAGLAREVIARARAARGGNVTFETGEPASIRSDKTDIEAALFNLVDNALKYGEGSAVHVEVLRERGQVVVRVSDSGPGIPPAEHERIFERFYRGAHGASIEGSGLGLAIAVRAVERARGTLTLEHSAAGCTTFAIRLPLENSATVD